MALFSRRKKDDDDSNTPGGESGAAEAAGDEPSDAAAEPAGAAREEDVPHVGISVSAYRGAAAPPPGVGAPAGGSAAAAPPASASASPPRVRGPQFAPEVSETVPGLRDNALVREALAAISAPPTQGDLADVARQLMQGHLFLRVRGDARELVQQGQQLPLAVAKQGDKSYLVVYSSGRALQDAVKADGDANTSALGQPVSAIIAHVLAGDTSGILLDGSSGSARAIIPREVLEQARAQADPQARIKTLLAGERTDDTGAQIAAAIADGAPLWVALGEAGKDEQGKPKYGVAEGRTPQGERFVEVYSHPLEVLAMRRSNRAMPVTTVQLTGLVRSNDAITGIVVDPGGPWIQILRDTLAPIFAAADASAAAPPADAAPEV